MLETVVYSTKQTQKWKSCKYSHYESMYTYQNFQSASCILICCMIPRSEHCIRLLNTKMAIDYHPNPNPTIIEYEATPEETRIKSKQTTVR